MATDHGEPLAFQPLVHVGLLGLREDASGPGGLQEMEEHAHRHTAAQGTLSFLAD